MTVIPGWTVLNSEMACSWKVVWNVDPLPSSCPLSWALLLVAEALAVDDELVVVDELDDEHAARESAMATKAAPAVKACCLRPSCMISEPLLCVPAAMSAVADGRSSCEPYVPVQSGRAAGTCG